MCKRVNMVYCPTWTHNRSLETNLSRQSTTLVLKTKPTLTKKMPNTQRSAQETNTSKLALFKNIWKYLKTPTPQQSADVYVQIIVHSLCTFLQQLCCEGTLVRIYKFVDSPVAYLEFWKGSPPASEIQSCSHLSVH